MPNLISIAKITVLAACGFGLANGSVIYQQKTVTEFGQEVWAEAQHVFHDVSQRGHETVHEGGNKVLQKSTFTTFTHPSFSEYALRYKKPSLCDPSVNQLSGYLDVRGDKHFFFWFFESRNKPKTDPIILWLNGGPGGSSLMGLLTELGPCSVNEDGTGTYINKYSWNNEANIIFLDQPVNVGYSYGNDSAPNTDAAADDVFAFLQLFFTEFPQYADLDFHIAGESYAGHYIPAIGSVINENNKGNFRSLELLKGESNLKHINLKSVLIGNGMTDPLIQYKYYAKMACENTYASVLGKDICDKMETQLPVCERLIQNCYDNPNVTSCLQADMKCTKDQVEPFAQTGMNPYDLREKCENGDLCYAFYESIEKYLNIPEVMKELGAQVEKYESVNMHVNFRFQMSGDLMRPYVDYVPVLLEDGIRVLIYAGDADFVCNWMGNKAWTIELPWSGHEEFSQANDTEWYSTRLSKQAGELRKTEDGAFAFLRVFGAGHMVPYDQPESSLDMLQQWIHNDLH